jgi:regulator of sigma E protease
VTGLNVVVFILILMALVLVHEAGHLVVAKWCGMRVERFSIFFGRPLTSFRRGETEYAIGWLPLGGYVKITGMTREENLPPEVVPRAYYSAKPWKRIVTILAGPGVNIILAFLIFCVVFWIGPTLQVPSTTIGRVDPGTPAASIGLRPGDTILSVNGTAAREDFTTIQRELRSNPGDVVTIRYTTADGDLRTAQVRLRAERENGELVGKLGFSPRLEDGPKVSSGFSGGVVEAGRYTRFLVEENAKGIGRLFTSEEARRDVSSVVGIGAAYNEVSEDGFLTILRFIGVISLVLGIFNLLPFLPLDGGHILFTIIEKLKGSPVRRQAYERFSIVGFALLAIVFVFALQNDIGRLTGEGFTPR